MNLQAVHACLRTVFFAPLRCTCVRTSGFKRESGDVMMLLMMRLTMTMMLRMIMMMKKKMVVMMMTTMMFVTSGLILFLVLEIRIVIPALWSACF